MTLYGYDNRPVCGAYVVLRSIDDAAVEVAMCTRKGGVCPVRTRQPDGGSPRLRDGDVCAASTEQREPK